MTDKKILIAFGSVPKDGGTFTFYRTIRPGLLKYGIDIRCVSIGKREANIREGIFVDEGCVLLAEHTDNIKNQAKLFTDWCDTEGVDMVFAINSIAMLSALPHLQEKIRIMARCANAFDHGYKITVSCYERLMRIVTTAPRHAFDLVKDHGVSRERIHMIPNGIAPALFDEPAQKPRGVEQVLRLGFLGRLEHNQKGVLFLPEILRRLQDQHINFTCQIAGKGVHEKALRQELSSLIEQGIVEFTGPLAPTEVPTFLGSIDIYLLPSQFEGCPNALLEAIMAGCAPVAWILEGITDFIIKDGDTGFVCRFGDSAAFADRIIELAHDRQRLQKMANAAARDARLRFSQSRVAADYAQLINQVMAEPVRPWTPRPWSDFQLDPAFNTSRWRDAVPQPLKKILKNCLFHLRLSKRYEQ